MEKTILEYYKKITEKLNIMTVSDEVGKNTKTYYYVSEEDDLVDVRLIKKNKIIRKLILLGEMEELLRNYSKYSMISIGQYQDRKSVYHILSKVSKQRGICSPFIELRDGIIYFPKCSYSDMGLLRHLCEQGNLQDYRLLMISGC